MAFTREKNVKECKRRDLVYFHSISELKVVYLLEKKLDRAERAQSLAGGQSFSQTWSN